VAVGREVLGQPELLGGGLILLGIIVSETGAPLWSLLSGRRFYP
jgi:hypothetical protein